MLFQTHFDALKKLVVAHHTFKGSSPLSELIWAGGVGGLAPRKEAGAILNSFMLLLSNLHTLISIYQQQKKYR